MYIHHTYIFKNPFKKPGDAPHPADVVTVIQLTYMYPCIYVYHLTHSLTHTHTHTQGDAGPGVGEEPGAGEDGVEEGEVAPHDGGGRGGRSRRELELERQLEEVPFVLV